jgi:hypothetical protein
MLRAKPFRPQKRKSGSAKHDVLIFVGNFCHPECGCSLRKSMRILANPDPQPFFVFFKTLNYERFPLFLVNFPRLLKEISSFWMGKAEPKK